jgi:hypothetical protein
MRGAEILCGVARRYRKGRYKKLRTTHQHVGSLHPLRAMQTSWQHPSEISSRLMRSPYKTVAAEMRTCIFNPWTEFTGRGSKKGLATRSSRMRTAAACQNPAASFCDENWKRISWERIAAQLPDARGGSGPNERDAWTRNGANSP